MQTNHFTYDELTPLEQCIADFMARQEQKNQDRKTQKPARKSSQLLQNA